MSTEQRKITLLQENDGWWVTREEMIGLTIQAETRDDALDNLDEIIDAVENDAG